MAIEPELLLIVGGAEDPNIRRLQDAASRRSIAHRCLLVGGGNYPSLTWDLDGDELLIDRTPYRPTSVFLRYDVFAGLKDPRPSVLSRARVWYATASSWALAHPDVRYFNRNATPLMGSKPAVLKLAKQCGLSVPRTWISNDPSFIRKRVARDGIAKPVDGGDFCKELEDALSTAEERNGCLANPAIVQAKMRQPEVRVYFIGGRRVAFNMKSTSLDYRVNQDAEVSLLSDAPMDECEGVDLLMRELGMDFGAVDLKTDAESGRLNFLEINSAPMFAHFDYVSEGRVCDIILDALSTCRRPEPAPTDPQPSQTGPQ